MTNTRHLPKIDAGALLDLWDWLSRRAGRDGEPGWWQKDYVEWFTHPSYEQEVDPGARPGVDAGALIPELEALNEEDPDYLTAESFNLGESPEEFCGTAFCAAGYVLRGHVDHNGWLRRMDFITSPAGEPVMIQSFHNGAKHLLGLTEREADNLFAASNTREDMREIINEVLASRGEERRCV